MGRCSMNRESLALLNQACIQQPPGPEVQTQNNSDASTPRGLLGEPRAALDKKHHPCRLQWPLSGPPSLIQEVTHIMKGRKLWMPLQIQFSIPDP